MKTIYTSEELNEQISNMETDAHPVKGLEGTGKSVPYIGWYWRNVDFKEYGYYPLGEIPDMFIGFMVNNKWGYKSWYPMEDQAKEIHRLLINAVLSDETKDFQELFNYIQTCKEVRNGKS